MSFFFQFLDFLPEVRPFILIYKSIEDTMLLPVVREVVSCFILNKWMQYVFAEESDRQFFYLSIGSILE